MKKTAKKTAKKKASKYTSDIAIDTGYRTLTKAGKKPYRDMLRKFPNCGWKREMLKLLDQTSISNKKFEKIDDIKILFKFMRF